MNELMYSFRENKVRVVMKENEPWFVAKDVCDVLGISKYRDAYSRLDDDERGSLLVDTLGGKQPTGGINEYGLYSLVMKSRKKEAKEFKRWVTHEILPSIRKNGSYSVSQDSYMIIDPVERAKKWIEEEKERQVLRNNLEQQKPKVLLAESIENSHSLILVGELAKILKQNGFDIGQNRLYERLRDMGYLVKSGASKNSPTQRSMELGLFRVVEGTRTNDKGVNITKTTKVTGKGQKYFINKFLKEVN